MSIYSGADAKPLCNHALQKGKTEYIKWTTKYHIIGANYVEPAPNNIYGIGVGARNIFLRSSSMTVITWIPSHNYSMSGTWFFFQKLNCFAELVPSEMISPTPTVSRRESAVCF